MATVRVNPAAAAMMGKRTARLGRRVRCLEGVGWMDAAVPMLALQAGSRRIVSANRAMSAMTGHSRSTLVGLSLEALLPSSEHPHVDVALREAVRNAGLARSRNMVFHAGGGARLTEIAWSESTPVRGESVIVAAFREVSRERAIEHQLLAQNWALRAYARAVECLTLTGDPRLLMERICQAIVTEPAYVLAWIGVAEDSPGLPVGVAASAGPAVSYLDGLDVSWAADRPEGRGPTGCCIRSGERVVMRDSEAEDHFAPWRERAQRSGIRSSASIPFRAGSGASCALMVYASLPDAFEVDALGVFEALAGQLGHGLHALEQAAILRVEHAEVESAKGRLTEALTATIGALSSTLEARDPYTAGHQLRVARLAVAIGEELGWSTERIAGLRLAAMVHDIGKIAVPSEILTKPTRLTPMERGLINEHPETGYQILRGVPFERPVAEIVRQHHEKVDGSGYPRGLRMEALLPESRVLAVADIVEAMSSFRPYRPAMGVDLALAEVEREAGRTLDPLAVAACLTLFRERGFQLA